MTKWGVCHFYAVIEDRVAGFISGYTQTWHDGVHIIGQELAVDAALRGKAAGTNLLQRVLQVGARAGCISFDGETMRGTQAYEFWKKRNAEFSGFEHFRIPLHDGHY